MGYQEDNLNRGLLNFFFDKPTQFQMDSEANVAVVSQSTHASVWKSSSVSIIRTCEMYV